MDRSLELEPDEVRVASWNVEGLLETPRRSVLQSLDPNFQIALTAIAFVAAGEIVLYFYSQRGPLQVGLATLAILAGTIFFLQWRAERRKVPVPWESDGLGAQQFKVELDVVQYGVITGCDTGLMWVERGALCFAGSATSFAITNDLLAWERLENRTHTLRPFSRTIELPLAPVRGLADWRIQFDVISEGRVSDYMDMLDQLKRFAAIPHSSRLRQMPPTSQGPGAQTRGELAKLRLFWFTSWVAAEVVLAAGALQLIGSGASPIFLDVIGWVVLALAMPRARLKASSKSLKGWPMVRRVPRIEGKARLASVEEAEEAGNIGSLPSVTTFESGSLSVCDEGSDVGD